MTTTAVEKWSGRRTTVIRQAVLFRDRGICHLCQLPGADSVDHLVPVAAGGAVWDLDNMAAAHLRPCNQGRGPALLSPELLASFRTAEWRERVVGHVSVDARSFFEGW